MRAASVNTSLAPSCTSQSLAHLPQMAMAMPERMGEGCDVEAAWADIAAAKIKLKCQVATIGDPYLVRPVRA